MLERQSVVAARTYLSMQLTAAQRPVREAGLGIRWYFQMGKGIRQQLMCRQPCRCSTHTMSTRPLSAGWPASAGLSVACGAAGEQVLLSPVCALTVHVYCLLSVSSLVKVPSSTTPSPTSQVGLLWLCWSHLFEKTRSVFSFN